MQQRTRKYRGWDTRRKEMVTNLQISHDGLVKTLENEDGEVAMQWRLNRDVIVMDYTGLKDKNGKEIWEGDIISLQTYADGITRQLATVVWDVSLAGFALYQLEWTDLWNMDTINSYKGEVLGNIYENPSLLTPTRKAIV